MSVKRTFSLDPEVDKFLSQQGNRSKTVNAIIKRYMAETEKQQLIETYKAMHSEVAMAELREWESTIADGLEEDEV